MHSIKSGQGNECGGKKRTQLIDFDVDGTLRRTLSGAPFPQHADDIQILPGRREKLQERVDAGCQLFLVSNQGGIAAGMVGHEVVQAELTRTCELPGVPIAETVYCPHPANPAGCFCRKPMPRFGVYLMLRHQVSRDETAMVGDMESDAEFAEGLGIRFHHADEFFSAVPGVDSHPPGVNTP